uniref:Uncharacterized protein n=1 Tax=Triticum urartu TaxID=4572 RepID=A0A8R7PQ16_TRIUA
MNGGLCPLTPEEIALVLKALDIDGEIYGGQRRMVALTSAYPKVVRKATLLPSGLWVFQMAALDYMLSLESDELRHLRMLLVVSCNMAKVVEGHCR